MFVENGHNKQLLKNLVIKYNNKKNNKNNHENNTENRKYKNLKKLPWIPNISLKIKRGDIVFTLGKIYSKFSVKKTNSNYYQIATQEYISQSARAMGNILAGQKRGFLHDAQNINRIVSVENGNHLGLQNIQKNGMVNSTGCIRKQYAFHHNEKDKTFTVLDRGNGDYVTTNSWKLLFMKMGNR